MKKVLIITYYWPPSGGAGVQRWVKFVKYLSTMQVDTYVLTVNPQFATYPQIDKSLAEDIPKSVNVFYTKSFELYSLYKKISSNKEVPYGGFANTTTLNLKEKILRFIRGNFFLPDPRRGWNRFALKEAIKIINTYQINTIITTSPPHSSQLIGLQLKKITKVKWIADFRDPWTDIYYYKQMYPTSIATFINKSLEKKVFKGADKIITVSEELKALFYSKFNITENKIEVIANGFDADDFSATIPAKRKNNFFNISYVGTISKEYNTDGFIEALTHLPIEIRSKIKIRFIGKINSGFIEKLYERGLDKMIEIVGYVNHDIAIQYMLSSNVLLLIIPEVTNNKGILTGKLFEYLACKIPILFLGPVNGDAANIINETQSGIICDYHDVDKIAESLTHFFNITQKPDESKLKFLNIENYSRENLTKKVLKLI